MLRPLLLPLLLVAALPAVHGTATNCSVGTWQTGDAENFYREPACDNGHLCQIKVTTAEDEKVVKKEGACVAACGVDRGKCMILKGTVIFECCLDDGDELQDLLSNLASKSRILAQTNGPVTITAANLNEAAKIVKGVQVGENYHFLNIRLSLGTFFSEPKTPGSINNPNPKPESAAPPPAPPAPPPPAPSKDSTTVAPVAGSPDDKPAPLSSGETSAELRSSGETKAQSLSVATATLTALAMTMAALL